MSVYNCFVNIDGIVIFVQFIFMHFFSYSFCHRIYGNHGDINVVSMTTGRGGGYCHVSRQEISRPQACSFQKER